MSMFELTRIPGNLDPRLICMLAAWIPRRLDLIVVLMSGMCDLDTLMPRDGCG